MILPLEELENRYTTSNKVLSQYVELSDTQDATVA